MSTINFLLVNLPPWGIDNPPLGTACLYSYLKDKNINVDIFDLNIKLYNKIPEKYKYLWTMNYSHLWRQEDKFKNIQKELESYLNPFVEEIVASSYNIFGFSLPTNCSDYIAIYIIEKIKNVNPDKKIILGGVSISVNEQRKALLVKIKNYVDYCIIGEGEQILYNLIMAIANREDEKINGMPGILEKETFFDNALPTSVGDLNNLPFPTFEKFNLNEYNTSDSIIMEFSRGCIGNCSFCDFKSVSPLFKSKSASYIFNQIKFYKEKYNINHITVCDSAVNGDLKTLEELCDLLIKNNLSVRISALAIPRKEMTEDLLKKMRSAGFYRLEYGVETGSNKILKAMRKIFTKETAERVIKDTYKAGMKTYLYFMIGYPGETEEDFNETEEFLKRNAPFIMVRSINPLYVMAGSEIFYKYREYGMVMPNKDSDINWYIPSENNTRKLREMRVKRLRNLINQLHIPYTEDAENVEFTSDKGKFVFTTSLPQEADSTARQASRIDMGCSQYSKEEKAVEQAGVSGDHDLFLVMVPPWHTKMVPLGLAYLGEFLDSQGVDVKIVDLNVKLFNSCAERKKFFWDISTINNFSPVHLAKNFTRAFDKELREFVDMICNSSAKLVGFSTTIANINIALYLGQQIKLRDSSKLIILGGPGCFFNACNVDSQGLIDLFVVGEGELPLLEIVKRFKVKNSVESLLGVRGTIIYMHKTYHSFLPPNPVKNINEIPFPRFKEFDLKNYNKENTYKHLPLLISRGCINNCSFCVDHKMNYPFRFRDPQKVLEAIKFYVDNFGVITFEFNDLLCNGNLKQLESICNLIIEQDLDIKWSSYAAIREGMSLELCRKMRKAGCRYICYGLESASNTVLKKMNKRHNALLAEKVVRNTYASGIETAVNIVIGHPGESEKEFQATCEFIKRNKDYIDRVTSISTCFLIPESDLVRNFKKYGIYCKPSLKQIINFIFRKRDSSPDYRKFCTYPGNTPSARARWTRKFLTLLRRLQIPYTIINYEKEYDLNLDKFLEKIEKNVNILKYNYFKLDFSQKGQGKLYFRNQEITKDIGMNVSFNINKKWFDSSLAKWKVKSFGRTLDIELRWLDISLAQHWLIKFKHKSIIDWQVRTYFNDETRVFQYKIGMMLSDQYTKYALKETIGNFSNLFTDNWEETLFSTTNRIKISTDTFLPPLLFTGKFNGDIFTQIHNTPLSLHTRIVNFCLLANNTLQDCNDQGRRFNKGDVLKGRLEINLEV